MIGNVLGGIICFSFMSMFLLVSILDLKVQCLFNCEWQKKAVKSHCPIRCYRTPGGASIGFLSLYVIDWLVQLILCGGGCLEHLGSLAGSSVTSNPRYWRSTPHPPPVVTTKNISRHCQMSSAGAKQPWLGVPGLVWLQDSPALKLPSDHLLIVEILLRRWSHSTVGSLDSSPL